MTTILNTRRSSRRLTAAIAGAAAVLLAAGAPLAAHAATVPITEGHTDIVSIGAAEQVGSFFEQDAIGFQAWPTADDHPIVFDNAAWIADGNASLYNGNGTYVVPNDHDIEELLPFVGFNYPQNSGTNEFEISLSHTPGTVASGDVRLIGSGGTLDTANPGPYTLSPGQHSHFVIELDGTATGTQTYPVRFTVENAEASETVVLDTVLTIQN